MYATLLNPKYPKAIILCNTEAKKSIDARKQEFLRLGSQKTTEAVAYFDEAPWEEERLKVFFDACAPYISKTQYDWLPAAKTNLAVWAQFAKEWNVMDLREDLKASVQCPTLILAGGDDPNHPIACAVETANCIPKQYLHFDPIPGAGAPVYQDQPEAFRKRVEAFLQEII
jgi:pimeloyl-ACP methyl ester carboxylesterase